MKVKYLSAILCSLLLFNYNAQEDSVQVDAPTIVKSNEQTVEHYREEDLSTNLSEEEIHLPSITLGAGMLTFYGEASKGNKRNGATLSRVAYHIGLHQKVTSFLDAELFFLKGKIGANERNLTRNINFRSDVSALGVRLFYNFDHIIPPNRYLTPYISFGVEALEFLSKTDLLDANGNAYHYWSDGSIRDIAESASNAASAVRIQRDFDYESDIRESNLDGFGKYKERTIALPIGVGIKMDLTDRLMFNLSTELHYTTTDFIDGITDQSIGNRKGDENNDHLLYTSFGLSYNFNPEINDVSKIVLPPNDLMAMDLDGDGVVDFHDNCPDTPELVEVDAQGCPLDLDEDGVPDYRDEEIDTPAGLFVKQNGEAYDDEDYLAMYNAYEFGLNPDASLDTVYTLTYSDGADQIRSDKYMVQIGSFKGGLPQDVAEELLSIPDANTWEENGITYITVGSFDNVPDALRRKIELESEGFGGTDVVTSDGYHKLEKVENITQYTASEGNSDYYSATQLDQSDEVIKYRVQVGAFRNRLSKKIFRDVPGIIMVPFEDGLSRYYTNSYANFKDAAKVKVDMLERGYQGAFIVAFREGRRISLQDAGVSFVSDVAQVDQSVKSSVNKNLVKFSVQIGAWKGEVPPEVVNIALTLDKVQRERTDEDLIRYFSGHFDTPEQAEDFKQQLISKGLVNSVVIGRFKSSTITVQEALELLK